MNSRLGVKFVCDSGQFLKYPAIRYFVSPGVITSRVTESDAL